LFLLLAELTGRPSELSGCYLILRFIFPSGAQQPGQPGKVVGGHRKNDAGSHPLNAAIDGLSHATDGFCPAESLFDPLAVFEGQGVALVPGGAAINGEVSRPPSNMRGHAGLPEAGDKLGGVIPFVRAKRQSPGRSGRMTMHRAMLPPSV